MTKLQNYHQFDGRHWETGTVRNAYDYLGVKVPHTGEPFTEAMLMGVSGGAVMGYFSFAYEGYDPHARILTRNTFDPWNTMLERLGVVQNVIRTAKPEKAVTNLVDVLANGEPAIVWADLFLLPYNNLKFDEGEWGMFPILVYGYDESEDKVWIADRARVPLTVTTGQLAKARGRVKKDKNQIITLEAPNMDKLSTAVQMGIWDTIKIYTEKPPKGPKSSFGLSAYLTWVEKLTKPKARMSWEKEFPAGRKMYAGLTSQYTDIMIFGKTGNTDRDLYADFLNESSVILNKPALKAPSEIFRRSGAAWNTLAQALLPDDVAPFRETRELMEKRRTLFIEKGGDALTDIQAIDKRLDEIKISMETDFPLDEAGVVVMRENIAEHVMRVHDIESEAVAALQDAMN